MVHPSVDVWALAVVAFEVVVGQRALRSSSDIHRCALEEAKYPWCDAATEYGLVGCTLRELGTWTCHCLRAIGCNEVTLQAGRAGGCTLMHLCFFYVRPAWIACAHFIRTSDTCTAVLATAHRSGRRHIWERSCREACEGEQPAAWRTSRLQPLLLPCLARDPAQRPTAEQVQRAVSGLGQQS